MTTDSNRLGYTVFDISSAGRFAGLIDFASKFIDFYVYSMILGNEPVKSFEDVSC